jgi:hypothetical protein
MTATEIGSILTMTMIEIESTSGITKMNEIGSMSDTMTLILTTHQQLRTRAKIIDNRIATAMRMDQVQLTKIQLNGVALDPVTIVETVVMVIVIPVVTAMEEEVDMEGEAVMEEEAAMVGEDTTLAVSNRTNCCPFYWLDCWVYWPSFYTFGQRQQQRLESAA